MLSYLWVLTLSEPKENVPLDVYEIINQIGLLMKFKSVKAHLYSGFSSKKFDTSVILMSKNFFYILD